MPIRSRATAVMAGNWRKVVRPLLLSGSLVAILASPGTQASAQSMPNDGGTPPAETTGQVNPDVKSGDQTDIIVTARKQSERLIDVPQSVSAL